MLVRFVSAGTTAIGAALAAFVGLAVTPRRAAETRRWRPIASLSDLPADGPLAAVLTERHSDGWYQTRKQTVVYLDREGEGYRAISAICTHLGCRVRWDATSRQFLCPCHGGAYDRTGQVAAGPPPAPLARVNVRMNAQTSELEVEL